MSILLALVIGLGIGAAGQYVMRKEADTLLMSILSGTVGSILGLVAYGVMDFNAATLTLFSLPSVLFCAIGALLAVAIFAATYTFMEKHSEAQAETGRTKTESKIEKNPVHKKTRD